MSNPTHLVYELTAPTLEPLSLDEVKQSLEIASATTSHDALLERLVSEARQAVEDDTGHLAGTRSLVEKLDDWPATWIELHRRPVTSVTSITYIDAAGVTQTWSSAYYVVDLYRVRPCIRLAYQQSWPTVRGDESGIAVTYVAGYAARASIPETFRQAVLLRVAQMFDDRTGEMWEKRERAYEAVIQRLMRSSYP